MKNIKNSGLLAVACLVGGGSVRAAEAQSEASNQTEAHPESGVVAEIVVTAQKREQRLQDVPVAVTAIMPETLQANRITSVADLSGLAPGLVARKSAGGLGAMSVALRGEVTNSTAPGTDKAISIYLDGVYLGGREEQDSAGPTFPFWWLTRDRWMPKALSLN